MNTQPPEVLEKPRQSAGAALLWCVLAGALVATLLIVEPPEGRGLEFWTPAGALRLLADLIVFHCFFLLPVFDRRRARSMTSSLHAAGVVLFTGIVGLVLLNYLVGLKPAVLVALSAFVVLVAAGAVSWAKALEARRGVYYSVAAAAALGLPFVGFFCDEIFRIKADWLDYISPFTAWRLVMNPQGSAAAAWIVFGVVLVTGGVACFVHVRRRDR